MNRRMPNAWNGTSHDTNTHAPRASNAHSAVRAAILASTVIVVPGLTPERKSHEPATPRDLLIACFAFMLLLMAALADLAFRV